MAAIYEIKMSLRTIDQSLRFFQKAEASRYPNLQQLGQDVSLDKGLVKALDKVIDDKGAVKDDATQELLWIKRELMEQQGALAQADKQYPETGQGRRLV